MSYNTDRNVSRCLPINTYTHSAQWRASSARLGHDGTDSLTSELERRLRASREAALEGATQKRVGEAVTFDEGQWEGEVADAIMSASSASKR